MKRFESIVALLLTVCMVISSSVVPVFAASTIRITFAADEEQMLSNNITGDPATVYTLKVSANEAFSAFGFILSYDTTKIQPVKVNPVRKMYADVTPADGVAEEVESMSLLAKVQFPAYEDAWGDQVTPEPVPYDNEYKIATAGNRKGLYVTISTAETDLSTTKGQEIMTFTYRYISGEPSKGDLRLEIDKDSAVFDVLGLSDDSDKAKGLVVLDAAKIQYSAWAGDLSYSFSYTGSDKITLGALELEADEPAIKVNGSLDKANHVVELTLTAKDTDGGAMTLPADTTYEFDAGTTTASLSDDGTTITIPKNSPAGTIAVKAVSSDGTVESNVVTIAVTRAASKVTTVELTGGGVTPDGMLFIDGVNEKTLQASAYDQFGGKIEVKWSVEPEDETYEGVSIDENGRITVKKNASVNKNNDHQGYYEIVAEDKNGNDFGKKLTVIRANTIVVTDFALGGVDEIDVPKVNWASDAIDASCSESYTVSAKNIYGDEVKINADVITWSVTEGAKGVSIADGTLTVTNKAEQGSVVITAKYGTLTATKTVQLKKDNNIRAAAVKLEESTVTVDGKNGAETTAKAYDQYGNPIDSGTWSVNDGGNNVSIKNGKITVAKDAAEGSYTISVENLLGDTVSATLTVVRANKGKAVDFTIAGLTEIAVPEFNQSSGRGWL